MCLKSKALVTQFVGNLAVMVGGLGMVAMPRVGKHSLERLATGKLLVFAVSIDPKLTPAPHPEGTASQNSAILPA